MSRPGPKARPASDPAGRPVLLVLRALGLGDFLTGLPALRALADAFADHRRVLAMPGALAPLAALAGCGPERRAGGVVNDVVAVDGVNGLHSLDGRWAAPFQRVDVAVNLHGCGPDSHRLLLSLQPRRLIAFAHPGVPESAGSPGWREDEHEVLRWCRLLWESGIAADTDRLDLAPPPVEVVAPHLAELVRGATIVHPGAASGARRWPASRWAEVARRERDRGREVVVTGGPSELRLATSVASRAQLRSGAVLAGRTDVVQLAAVVAAAGTVLSADTGVAHLATAVGTPSVVLFGPTPPSRWGPPTERVIHAALWAGSVGDPHARRPHPGLLAITVDDVVAAAKGILPPSAPPMRSEHPCTGRAATAPPRAGRGDRLSVV